MGWLGSGWEGRGVERAKYRWIRVKHPCRIPLLCSGWEGVAGPCKAPGAGWAGSGSLQFGEFE